MDTSSAIMDTSSAIMDTKMKYKDRRSLRVFGEFSNNDTYQRNWYVVMICFDLMTAYGFVELGKIG